MRAAPRAESTARVVRLLVTQLSGRMALGAMRPKTVHGALRVVLDFVNRADRQGLHQELCDEKATAEAVHQPFTRVVGYRVKSIFRQTLPSFAHSVPGQHPCVPISARKSPQPHYHSINQWIAR